MSKRKMANVGWEMTYEYVRGDGYERADKGHRLAAQIRPLRFFRSREVDDRAKDQRFVVAPRLLKSEEPKIAYRRRKQGGA